MRTIDILTTQNVTINYELAEARDRIFAWIIDTVALYITLLLLALIFLSSGIVGDGMYFSYFVLLPIYLFYHLAFEILFDGRSLGKMALGLKVVKLTGTEPSLNDYLVRWVFRPIDISLSLGSIAIMLVSSSEKGQRLGDVVANTTVIKVNPTQKIRLYDILNIRTVQNYTPVYPQVHQFTEDDMLLLKEVMDRNIKYPNHAHAEALDHALQIVQEKLHIEQLPADRILFIRTLIKDFVALSR